MAAGVPIIPIKQNSKEPVCTWGNLSSSEQWQLAGGEQFSGNIAGILGNGIAVLDADNLQADKNISLFLDGLGIRAPQVQTPSGGHHYWVRVADAPEGENYRILSPEIGAGELRVANCFVLVPSSAIGAKAYQFEYGSPEMIGSQRAIRWQDLLKVIPEQRTAKQVLESLPVRLLRRDAPWRAMQLFAFLSGAEKREPIDSMRYASRSEAEAACVANLILAGWNYSEIAQAFESEQPAHYCDAGASGKRYLKLTYQNVISDIASTEERITLANWYQQAEELTWQGAGGALDLAVYQALCAIAYQHKSYTVNASQRDLSEHAAASRFGVANALERLERDGLVRKLAAGAGALGSLWHVRAPKNSRKHAISHNINKHKTKEKQGAGSKSEQQAAGMAQLFARGGLGRSARLVLAVLDGEMCSITELAKLTGKNWHTVQSALEVLESHGLAEHHGRRWCKASQPVPSLVQLAEQLDLPALEERRRERYKSERVAWRLRLAAISSHRCSHRSKREHSSKRKRKREIFEPALRAKMREPALASQSRDLPCSVPVRDVPIERGMVLPNKPQGLCEHGHMAWYQPSHGARWRCSICDAYHHRRSPARELSPAEVEQRKKALLLQAEELAERTQKPVL